MKNILLIADLEEWILGRIAQEMATEYQKKGYFAKIIYTHSDDCISLLRKKRNDFDVVHFLSPWDFLTLKNFIKKPCVVTLWHMVDWTKIIRHQFRIDALLSASEISLRESRRRLLKKGLLIRQFRCYLDCQQFKFNESAREEFITSKNLQKEIKILGFAGKTSSNEHSRKGLDRLWNSLIKLKNESSIPFVLRIIGKGWDLKDVPSELLGNVCFDLDVSQKSLPDFYSSLDFYICTSRFEGVPYPVLEAMSCERVVFSTPVGLVPEIIENNLNGFLLRESSIEVDFCDYFLGVCNKPADEKQKIGLLARQSVVKDFGSAAPMIEDILHAYSDAINFFLNRNSLYRFFLTLRASLWFLIEPLLRRANYNFMVGYLKSRFNSLLGEV